jgi:two-component system, OmpR family, sensor kinase
VSVPGGIRVRLALGLVAIVAGALGTAYLIVVPSLEQRLVDARLDSLETRAVDLTGELTEDSETWDQTIADFAVRANARVVLFSVLDRNPLRLLVVAGASRGIEDDPIALATARSRQVERGRVVDRSEDYAEVAVLRQFDEAEVVLLYRIPLADSLATVELVERRLLLATAFALVLALLLGLTAAGMLAHRLRRLEAAADRIAGGHFDTPIVDRGDDEIGQLASSFDRMRVQLAQLDTARKEFVANASHELRTPLFSLGGFLELLADEELDEDTRREFLGTMQGQIARLTKLSTDLLDLSRVDAGQLQVVAEPVDLGEVVGRLGDEFDHVATSSGHVLETHANGDVWALADPERVAQIGRALLMNALVHTPEGTRVVVRAERRGERAELTVADDGPGIPAGQRGAVFERFYRVEGGKASGSGLGLAIAWELARLMNGTVRLESESGRTVVTLDVPGGEQAEPVSVFSRENGSEAPAEPPE